MLDIQEILDLLPNERPVFHSEKDFQFSLALKIKEKNPKMKIRLEVPMDSDGTNKRIERIDMKVIDGSTEIGIEVKYITEELIIIIDGEQFKLKNHSANDIRCYDVLKDIQRLERFVKSGSIKIGYSIVLTNVESLWNEKNGNKDTFYDNFRIYDGRRLTGKLEWKEKNINGEIKGPAEGTVKGRKSPIELEGNYELNWNEYPKGNLEEKFEKGHRQFKYLVIETKL